MRYFAACTYICLKLRRNMSVALDYRVKNLCEMKRKSLSKSPASSAISCFLFTMPTCCVWSTMCGNCITIISMNQSYWEMGRPGRSCCMKCWFKKILPSHLKLSFFLLTVVQFYFFQVLLCLLSVRILRKPFY